MALGLGWRREAGPAVHLLSKLGHNGQRPASLAKAHPGPWELRSVQGECDRAKCHFCAQISTWLASGLTKILELTVLHVSLAKNLASDTQRV